MYTRMSTHTNSLCYLGPLRPLFACNYRLLLAESLQFSIKRQCCQNGSHPHQDKDSHDDPEANRSCLAGRLVSRRCCVCKKKAKKGKWHCYGMLNSSKRHYDLQQIRQAFHFWRNLISKNCEWLLLMILEWINAILTLFFGERGWKAETDSQYSIKRVVEELFSKILKNRYDEQIQRKKWAKVSAFKLAKSPEKTFVRQRMLKLISTAAISAD